MTLVEQLSNISAADWIEFLFSLSPIFWVLVGVAGTLLTINAVNEHKGN